MGVTHAETSTTRADFDDYQQVVDIVNKGFADALTQILTHLADPNSFGEHVKNEAQRQGVPLEYSADEVRGLFPAFWQNCTGCFADLQWMNTAGVPDRTRSYVADIQPKQPDPSTDGSVSRWGFSLPFGISFHT